MDDDNKGLIFKIIIMVLGSLFGLFNYKTMENTKETSKVIKELKVQQAGMGLPHTLGK